MDIERKPDVQPTRIRVLVANVPEVLLWVIIRAVDDSADIELVGIAEDNLEILRAAGENVDVLVLGVEDDTMLPGICTLLLNEYPFLKILALAIGSERVSLYWLGLRQRRRKAANASALRALIRRAHALDITG